MASDELLTPTEVARMFHVSPKTVTRWATAGNITAIRTFVANRLALLVAGAILATCALAIGAADGGGATSSGTPTLSTRIVSRCMRVGAPVGVGESTCGCAEKTLRWEYKDAELTTMRSVRMRAELLSIVRGSCAPE